MKRLFLFSLSAVITGMLFGQTAPQRTAEDEARKQTAMMIRDLCLTDSLQKDTLYRLHVKFARLRRQLSSRYDRSATHHLFINELKGILTDEQYRRFVRLQADSLPRHPRRRIGIKPKQ